MPLLFGVRGVFGVACAAEPADATIEDELELDELDDAGADEQGLGVLATARDVVTRRGRRETN